MDALPDQVVFSVGGKEYRWEDVVTAARAWGDWDRLRTDARQAIACLSRLDEEEDAVSDEVIESAADEFRYSRDLVSAQEMEEWLNRWGLTAEDWMDWVRSWTLRQKWSDELADLVSRFAPDEDEVESFLPTEAICSGSLERLALRLAGQAAVARKEEASSDFEGSSPAREELAEIVGEFSGRLRDEESPGEPGDRSRVEDLARLELAVRRFRQRALTRAAIEREIRSHRAEWTRFDCRRIRFVGEDEAHEAALCVRADGKGLDEVAAAAGMEVETLRIILDEIEAELHDGFLSAKKGDLLGPFKSDGEFVLYWIVDKNPPSETEASMVRHAEKSILDRLVQREMDDSVRWAVLPRADL